MKLPITEIYSQILSKQDTYLSMIAKTHNVGKDVAKQIFESEIATFLNRISEYAAKNECELSIPQGTNIFLEVIQLGLSFNAGEKHIYLSKLKGTGRAIGYQVTVDGLILRAQKAGAIDHLTEPILVQKGEDFKIINTPDGKQIPQHTISFGDKRRFKFENLLLGYIFIIYPNGDRELSWIDKERLIKHKEKTTNPAMYDDEAFIQTKVIKHALRKVRKTGFMLKLEEQEEEIIAEHRDYSEDNTNTDEPF